MMKAAQKGFTLVELAVVIAIVAILAAVAVPKLVDSTDSAQAAVAQDFVSQLNSAASMYTAKQMASPDGFDDFVKTGAIAVADTQTLSTATLGAGSCTVAAAAINCTSAFNKLTAATYAWNNGAITSTVTK